MKRDLDITIKNMDGSNAIFTQDVPLTIMHCVQEALLATEPTTTKEEKNRRWNLLRKVKKGGTIDLSIEDAALISDATAKVHVVLVYGQVTDWLEAEPTETPAAAA